MRIQTRSKTRLPPRRTAPLTAISGSPGALLLRTLTTDTTLRLRPRPALTGSGRRTAPETGTSCATRPTTTTTLTLHTLTDSPTLEETALRPLIPLEPSPSAEPDSEPLLIGGKLTNLVVAQQGPARPGQVPSSTRGISQIPLVRQPLQLSLDERAG